MQYLCMKQLTLAGVTYYPGDIIPDGIILPERSGKLSRSGYISELGREEQQDQDDVLCKLFTEEEVQIRIADAVAAVERERAAQLSELQEHAAELREIEPGAFESVVPVTIFGEEEHMAVRLFPKEINQVFAVMQLKADEGVKMIEDVTSENVLILLHAADSRKTIKNAAKEQADKLFSAKGDSGESSGRHEAVGDSPEGS